MCRPTISLCMIVRNEAEHLPRCLSSVVGAVDEMIVVDTGSTDNTVDIARRFGAHVICSPWQDDFAYARNVGIDQATGEWIIWLDADEELEAEDREKLRMYAQHLEIEAFLFQIYNYTGDRSQGATINPVLRMFRNRPEYRFEGRIHEQIAISIHKHKPDAIYHITDVKIHHYGYRQEIVIKRDKIRRNIHLLQQMEEEKPNDPFTQYNLGVEYLRISNPQQALHAFRKAKSLIDPVTTSYAHLLYKYEIRCLLALGQLEDAIQMSDEGIGLFPQYTDLHHIKGACFTQLGKTEEAKKSYQHAFKLGPAASGYHTEEGMGTYQTCYELGILHEATRDNNAAVQWYMKALSFKSSLNPPLYRIFHLMRCNGAQAEIFPFIKEHFDFKTEGAIVKVIQILFDTDCLEPIPALTEQLKSNTFKEFKSMAQIKYQLLTGDLEKARHIFRQMHVHTKKKVKKWFEWAEKRKDLTIEDERSHEEFSWVIKIAFAHGRREEVLSLLNKWKNHRVDPETGKRIIRTLASLADTHLEILSKSYTFRDLVRDSRMSAPFEDGF